MYTYRNPVIPGFNPDPSVCRVGEDYYLVTSTFEFFPGVPVYHSRNLVNWEILGHCLNRPEQLPLENCRASRGIYAPTIRFRDGIFYLTSTNTNTGKDGRRLGNFIVHTGDIRGPWSDPVYVDQGGIDPSLLFTGGKAWFCSNGGMEGDPRGIYLCEIDPLTGEKLSPSRLISRGCGDKCTEAPHLYLIEGWYYLLLAEGGTEYGHMAVIQRSRDIYGPYENCPHNPILSHRKLHRHPIQATGHADLFEDGRGNWWMVCLGIRILDTQELHNLGRETFLVPVKWEEGWPVAGDGGTAALEMSGPLPEPPEPAVFDIVADFSAKELGLHWNYVRNPDLSRYRLKNGRLVLAGGAEGLSGMNPVFAGLRQQSFRAEAVTAVSAGIAAGVRAGISAYYNDAYHYDLALERGKEGLAVLVNRRVHDLEAVTYSVPLPLREGDVELRIRADSQWYYFSYRLAGGDWRDCGRGMTAGLCTEGTHFKTFTGVYIGLFSTGGTASFGGFTLAYPKEQT
ncbi:MAG: glycoside hydrolase family 43 protein [Treponema sp.]|nr:glycoside hydrolase family 43 protein [Treponema sp.]